LVLGDYFYRLVIVIWSLVIFQGHVEVYEIRS
jgi:hypothetical protein